MKFVPNHSLLKLLITMVQRTRGSHLHVCVEAFATGIKIESSDQSPFGGADQGIKVNQQSRMHGYNVTFDPWKSSDQEPQKGTIK